MMQFQHAEPPPVAFGGAGPSEGPVGEAVPAAVPLPFQRAQPKVGRNDVCPCGSGKKFKHCHGQLDGDASAAALVPTTDIGRNDLCPCGSGRKYKHCHGAIE